MGVALSHEPSSKLCGYDVCLRDERPQGHNSGLTPRCAYQSDSAWRDVSRLALRGGATDDLQTMLPAYAPLTTRSTMPRPRLIKGLARLYSGG